MISYDFVIDYDFFVNNFILGYVKGELNSIRLTYWRYGQHLKTLAPSPSENDGEGVHLIMAVE